MREDHLKQGSQVAPVDALIAGSFSGGIARAFTAPLDTLKIRMQLQTSAYKDRDKLLKVLRDILKHEGIRALWKGNIPAEMMYVVYGACQFTSYAILNKALMKFEDDFKVPGINPIHTILVGTGAGFFSTFVTYPLDLLRTRLVANKTRKFLSMFDVIKDIYRSSGIKGFMLGIKPAMLSVPISSGVMFYAYQGARELTRSTPNVPFLEVFCGFFAGVFSKGISFPLDTLRKRGQMQRSLTAVHTAGSIFRKEGAMGFYRGFGVSILKTAPTNAVSIYFYELSLNWLSSLREIRH